MTPEFERDLARFMQIRGFPTKSAAIREAVRESLDRARGCGAEALDFRDWIGAGLRVPGNPKPRFSSDEDLWTDS